MTNLTGKLLLAMPGIGDKRFDRSVILICAHTDEYAMGLTLNKPMTDLTLPTLLDQLGVPQTISLPERLVLDGGPVGTDRGFVIHSSDYFSDGATVDVSGDICMTATHDILKAIADGGAPRRSTLTLGYSGWGPGQIERELGENAWLISEPSDDILYGEKHSRKWEQTLGMLGIDPAHLHLTGGTA